MSIAQAVLLFVVPIVLLYFGVLPVQSRFVVLLIFCALIYSIMKREGWRDADVGLSFENIRRMVTPYIIATILGTIFLIVIANIFHFVPVSNWWTKPYFLFFFIFSSVFQEFAFRGFLMPVLGRIFRSNFMIVLANTVLFALMHSIYPFPMVTIPIAFVGGLLFAGMYARYPNLILVTVMHCVLNFVAVYNGFFTITS